MPRLKPLFQHRHYAMIASIIAELPIEDGGIYRRAVAKAFTMALLGTNPNYDADRFYNAAIGNPSGRDK